MTHEQLKVIASDLDISNFEDLSYNDLQKAVSEAKKAKEQTANSNETKPKENPDTTSLEPDPLMAASATINKIDYTDENGMVYKFTDGTPNTFRFNGLVKTKEEWLQDEEVMEQLALGNCSYVEQII